MKGAMFEYMKGWILVNGTHDVVLGHTISIGTLSGFVKIMDPCEWDTCVVSSYTISTGLPRVDE